MFSLSWMVVLQGWNWLAGGVSDEVLLAPVFQTSAAFSSMLKSPVRSDINFHKTKAVYPVKLMCDEMMFHVCFSLDFLHLFH